MTVYERVARLLAQYDTVAWEPLTPRDRDVYMMRAAAVVAVVDIAQESKIQAVRDALDVDPARYSCHRSVGYSVLRNIIRDIVDGDA